MPPPGMYPGYPGMYGAGAMGPAHHMIPHVTNSLLNHFFKQPDEKYIEHANQVSAKLNEIKEGIEKMPKGTSFDNQ